MIVVSDTTPLRYLAVIGKINLLPQLYGTVVCPEQVRVEGAHARAPAEVRHLLSNPPDWLRIVPDPVVAEDVAIGLDPGEACAIALAEQLSATVLLMDERKGRRRAESRGLAVAGTLNILADAAVHGLLDYPSVVADLRSKTNFRVSDAIVEAAWRAAKPSS